MQSIWKNLLLGLVGVASACLWRCFSSALAAFLILFSSARNSCSCLLFS